MRLPRFTADPAARETSVRPVTNDGMLDDESPGDAGTRPPAPPEPLSGGMMRLAALISMVATIPCLLLVLASNRGLDLTDEGFYLLSSQNPREYLESSSQFPLLLGVPWQILGEVYLMRLAKLAVLLTAGLVLGREVNRFIDASRPDDRGFWMRWATLVAVTGAVLAPYTWIAQSPGYNDLVALLMYATVWSALRIVRSESSGQRLPHLMLGVSVWLLFVTKWPVAVIVGAAGGAWYAFHWRQPRRAGLAAAGFGAALVVTHIALAPVPDIVRGQRQGNGAVGASYDSATLLDRYWTQISGIPRSAIVNHPVATALALVTVLMSAYVATSRRSEALAAFLGAMIVGVFVIRGRTPGGNGVMLSTSVFTAVFLVFVAIVLSALLSKRHLDRHWHDARHIISMTLIGIGLLTTPLVAALGTNNPILSIAVTCTPLWIVGLIVLAESTRVVPRLAQVSVVAAGVAMAAAISVAAVDGVWNAPYRQVPLSEAIVEITGGPFDGLRVDPVTAQAIDDLQAAVMQTEAQAVIGLGDVPGLVAATGRQQPLFSWMRPTLIERFERSVATACSRVDSVLVLEFSDDATLGPQPKYCPEFRWSLHATIEVPNGAVDVWWALAE